MVKRILGCLLLASLLLTGLSVQAYQGTGQTVTVTARYLNVRQGPNTSTTILLVIRVGQTYPVLGQSGTWWQISVGDISGYVSGRYVTVSGGSGTVNATPTPVVVTSNGTPCSTVIFFTSTPSDVCTGPVYQSKAAFQSYQHGFMIWLADSGDIWAFMNAPINVQPPWLDVLQSSYAGFPDATGSAPAGLVLPINGFGRLWANSPGVNQSHLKDELGWATSPEVSYNATRQVIGRANHVHIYINVPDGRVADAYSGLAGTFWSLN